MACAAYRARYNEWPAEARMGAIMLQDLAHLLDPDQFAALATHLRLSTKDRMALSVGRDGQVYEYGERELTEREQENIPLAERWLGIELRGRQLHD